YGNVGYFGIPMTIALLGPDAAVPAAIVHLLHNLVFLIGYPILRGERSQASGHADSQRSNRSLSRIGREIVSRIFLRPFTISTLLRLVVVSFSITVSNIIPVSLELLSSTAVPLALFAVGIAMHPSLASLRSCLLSFGMVMAGIGLENIIFPLVT